MQTTVDVYAFARHYLQMHDLHTALFSGLKVIQFSLAALAKYFSVSFLMLST